MKRILKFLSGILILSALAASAQTPPKLALAGVSVTPTLAGKFAAPAAPMPAATAPSAYANMLGAWNGNVGNGRWTITIKQLPSGILQAFVENHSLKRSRFGDSLVIEGNHIKLVFGMITMEGDVNPDFEIWQGVWTFIKPKGRPESVNFNLRRQPVSPPALVSAPPVSLAEVAHSLDVQLFDRFKGEQFFNIMGDAELKQTIAPTSQPPNPPYDLAKPDTAAQFKQAGIHYLLVPSLEDFSNQTIEKRRTTDSHYQTGIYYGAGAFSARFGRNGAAGAGAVARAGVATQRGFDPEVWQQQTIRLTVRGQLFDATTGELKKSINGTFSLQRDYTAVAQGQNQLSTADLCEAAARSVSAWATMLVDDTLFPIQVLSKSEQEITISRGAEAGLKVGQVFEVCLQGAAIKDPTTGQALGYDVKTVGRVAITKLEPKFSHAKVLADTGIVTGATLVKAVN